MLVMVLIATLLTGFYALVAADQLASGATRDQTQAYSAAHAGLEKLTTDLGQLFTGGNFNPSAADLSELEEDPPVFAGFAFEGPGGGPGYTVQQGATTTETIGAGPYQGLIGLITPYEMTVTARTLAAESRMRREVQTIAVPVFQFGIYSENDLSFFAGPPFNFGGRVHTNQNLYLAQDGNATLTLEDRVTAVGEIVRTHLANGLAISTSGHRGVVAVAQAPGVYRPLLCGPMGGSCGGGVQEGSVNIVSNTIPPALLQPDADGELVMNLRSPNTVNEPTWTNLSIGAYAGYIRNGRTGARRLDLPLVSDGAEPIDIIRRPNPAAPDPEPVARQRFFTMASLRILLSDTANDILSLPTVTAAAPIELGRLNNAGYRAAVGLAPLGPMVPPASAVAAPVYNNPTTAQKLLGRGYFFPAGSPLLTGFIKIERQRQNGTFQDVTVEILNLGITARSVAHNATFNVPEDPAAPATQNCLAASESPSPNAIIRLQRVRDNPGWSPPCGVNAAGTQWSATVSDYLPLALYDPREGTRRDDETAVGTVPYLAGVMHYVEFDVNNFRRWLLGQIGVNGPGTMDETGYVVYFSDRRGNRNLGGNGIQEVAGVGDDRETGELGFEDFINNDAASTSNFTLDPGEDLNGNGTLENYGRLPRMPIVNGAALVPNYGTLVPGGAQLTARVEPHAARVNSPLFFRRALKVINGAAGQLPANGAQGLTLAAENPVYVQGNYNANGAFGNGPGVDHVSAAVIADSLTLLSNTWNDIRSFAYPNTSQLAAAAAPPPIVTGRPATTTWYRLGIIAGKGINFPRPTNNPRDHTDFGNDGGAHNFIRYIENWGGQTLNYRGSIVSFFTNRQAVGVYKCCDVVYQPPSRGYRFDSEFLNPNLLPPRTPMFRDINTLSFRQLLRPTQ
jgi:hypothetical protein